MKRRLIHVLAASALALAAGGVAFMTSTPPVLAAASCGGAGYLCFYDYHTSQYGNVSGNNNNWGNFGWDERADWFYNQGVSCSVRVYQGLTKTGPVLTIARGKTLYWYNIVRSNLWC
jgi:hypothetical protein